MCCVPSLLGDQKCGTEKGEELCLRRCFNIGSGSVLYTVECQLSHSGTRGYQNILDN